MDPILKMLNNAAPADASPVADVPTAGGIVLLQLFDITALRS